MVRSSRQPQEIAGALERTLHGLDAGLPLTVKPWNQEMSSALFAARVSTVALGVLGMLGAMLAVTGIFGMASNNVSKRLRELGIRIALGARREQVLQTALGRAFWLLSVGSVVGIGCVLLASKLMSYIADQAAPKDPVVLAGVTFAMLLIVLWAPRIPAQRALRVNPTILMREE